MNKNFLSIMLLVSFVNSSVIFSLSAALDDLNQVQLSDSTDYDDFMPSVNNPKATQDDSSVVAIPDSTNYQDQGDFSHLSSDNLSKINTPISDENYNTDDESHYKEDLSNESMQGNLSEYESENEGSVVDQSENEGPTLSLKKVTKDAFVGGVNHLYETHKQKVHELAGKAIGHTGRFAVRGTKQLAGRLLDRFKNRSYESENRSHESENRSYESENRSHESENRPHESENRLLSRELPFHNEKVVRNERKKPVAHNHESENRSLNKELPFHYERTKATKTHKELNHGKNAAGQNRRIFRARRFTNR